MSVGGVWQVRGAYIVIESERAAAQGYPSPIHDCIEDTHANYNRCALKRLRRHVSAGSATRG